MSAVGVDEDTLYSKSTSMQVIQNSFIIFRVSTHNLKRITYTISYLNDRSNPYIALLRFVHSHGF